MIEPTKIDGKKLALIAWGTDEKGKDDVALFTGIAKWDGNQLTLDRRDGEPGISIPNNWLDRLKLVEQSLKETLLDSEYSISISVGHLPEDGESSDFKLLGLKWPKQEGDEESDPTRS